MRLNQRAERGGNVELTNNEKRQLLRGVVAAHRFFLMEQKSPDCGALGSSDANFDERRSELSCVGDAPTTQQKLRVFRGGMHWLTRNERHCRPSFVFC